jgi:hypothetical protein
MAAWIDQYLEPTEVSCRDICDDIRPVGTHNPGGGMSSSCEEPGSESAFRMTALVQAECTELWNAYFIEHGVDFILTPSLWGDPASYTELASGVSTVSVRQPGGTYKAEALERGYQKRSFWGFTKLWAVPKILIPLGLDAQGRPVSCTCWGKAVPKESMYDDAFAKSWDIPFMYKVRRAVEAIYASPMGPELRRQEPALNADIFGARGGSDGAGLGASMAQGSLAAKL